MQDKLAAARGIKTDLLAAERDYVVAMASTARLVGTVLDAQVKLEIGIAHGAVDEVVGVFTTLATGRREMIGVHGAMAVAARDTLGLPTVGIGGLEECPDELFGPTGQDRPLRIVAAG